MAEVEQRLADFLQRARAAEQRVRVVSPQDLPALLKSGAQLLDVGEPDEFAAAHLPEARSAPRSELKERVRTIHPDLDTLIVCYCRTGYRSALAADELTNLGYRRVFAVAGGLNSFPPGTELWSDYQI